MTKREFLATIINGTEITDEMKKFATEEVAKLDKANETKATKNREKHTSENAPLIAKCAELLADGQPRTAAEIGVALEVTTSKATAIAKAVEGVVVGEVRVKNRIVKTYSLEQ